MTTDTGSSRSSALAGETHVCFGLLTKLDLKDGRAIARVLGPGWTHAAKLTLFADGVALDEIEVAADAGRRAGVKAEHAWSLEKLGVKPGTFLAAVASGPGIDAPYWPMMPPYKATSDRFEPYVMGISPARWVE